MMDREETTLLIVDDRPENLLALEGVLEDLGYRIVKAASGQEVLRIVLKQPVDLILLDVQMPGMDGFEVAKLLQGRAETREIPIIFITAISKESKYVMKGYEVGAQNYLFKPIEPNELKIKVDAALKYARYKKQMELHKKRSKFSREESH